MFYYLKLKTFNLCSASCIFCFIATLCSAQNKSDSYRIDAPVQSLPNKFRENRNASLSECFAIAHKAADAIYAFRFASADSALQTLKAHHSKSHITWLSNTSYCWWLIISGEDSDTVKKNYYNSVNTALALLEAAMSEKGRKRESEQFSYDTLYSFIAIYAYKSRISMMNYHHFSALNQLHHCIGYYKDSFGKENRYQWLYLTSGIYNYYIESVKKRFPFLIPYLFLFPKGDQKKGIEQLSIAAASKDGILSTEATYFLAKLHLELEKNYVLTRKYLDELLAQYPSNLLFRYYHFNSLIREDNLEGAIQSLKILKRKAMNNNELSEKQKSHFLTIAHGDLKEYYLRKERGMQDK